MVQALSTIEVRIQRLMGRTGAKDLHSKPSEIKHTAEFEWHQGFSILRGSTLTTVVRKQEISPRRIAYMQHSLLWNGMVERLLLMSRMIQKRSEKTPVEWKLTNAVKSDFTHQFMSVIKDRGLTRE